MGLRECEKFCIVGVAQPSPILHPRRMPGKASLGAEQQQQQQQFAAARSSRQASKQLTARARCHTPRAGRSSTGARRCEVCVAACRDRGRGWGDQRGLLAVGAAGCGLRQREPQAGGAREALSRAGSLGSRDDGLPPVSEMRQIVQLFDAPSKLRR